MCEDNAIDTKIHMPTYKRTSLSYAHKEFMQRYDKVMIALDPDAKKKTLAFTKEMRNYVDDVVAINLVDDIKYKKDTDMNTIRRTIASWN